MADLEAKLQNGEPKGESASRHPSPENTTINLYRFNCLELVKDSGNEFEGMGQLDLFLLGAWTGLKLVVMAF